MARAKAAVPVEAKPELVKFPKERILAFKRYADRRDLLAALLQDGKAYTHEQIQSLLDNFMKGTVK